MNYKSAGWLFHEIVKKQCKLQSDGHSLFVERFKLLAPDFKETGTLVRTHQGPVLVVFHATHEQVGNPESEEQVARTMFLSTSVLPTIEVLEYVGVPRLQVDGKGARTLEHTVPKADCEHIISVIMVNVYSIQQWCRNEFESGEGGGTGKLFLVVPLHFLALKAQLVVLVSAFVMVSTVWSVSCLLFIYSRCPPCPAIFKSGGGGTCPLATWSRRHRYTAY